MNTSLPVHATAALLRAANVPGGGGVGCHFGAHERAWQERPLAQVLLQPPQCCALVSRFTQAPLHSTSGSTQVGATQRLPLHTCGLEQSLLLQHS
jgi:hypothetical protein